MTFKTMRNILSTAVLAFGIAACGGGGGGDSPTLTAAALTPTAAPAAQPEDMTGVVAVVLKDAPSDDFSQILVTFTTYRIAGQ